VAARAGHRDAEERGADGLDRFVEPVGACLADSRLFAPDRGGMNETAGDEKARRFVDTERIAGDRLELVELMGPQEDPHAFDPKPQDFARIQDAVLVLAMGKHLETYLDRLRENLPAGAPIFEVGRKVPSVVIDTANPIFMCCPAHSHGAVDPHWWHSPVAMRRAVRYLGEELEKLLPDQKNELRENTRKLMRELDDLHTWVGAEVSRIPAAQRKLVTAHASFGYFCETYGFQSIPVMGLTQERSPTPGYLAETVAILKREKIRAVFPDYNANSKVLETLRAETGVAVGTPLMADNLGAARMTYDAMIRHNVGAMVFGLAPREP
jgi:zinc/manganese transport system substrate-binding protein